MPIILALETSTELASAALLHGDACAALESAGVQTHSAAILPMVQRLLADAGIGLAQCDAIAFGSGPGSFTGVRTACGVAQGLAFGAGLPLLSVVTLAAMAEAGRAEAGAADVLALLDARMGEVYWAQYRYQDGGWITIAEPALSAPAAVQAQGAPLACGNGLSAFAAQFAGQPFVANARPELMPHARHVATLGCVALAQGRALAPQDAQPLYLRNQVALTTAERQARGHA